MYKPIELFHLHLRKLTLSVFKVRRGRKMAYQGYIDGVPCVVASNKATTLGRLIRTAYSLSRDSH